VEVDEDRYRALFHQCLQRTAFIRIYDDFMDRSDPTGQTEPLDRL